MGCVAGEARQGAGGGLVPRDTHECVQCEGAAGGCVDSQAEKGAGGDRGREEQSDGPAMRDERARAEARENGREIAGVFAICNSCLFWVGRARAVRGSWLVVGRSPLRREG